MVSEPVGEAATRSHRRHAWRASVQKPWGHAADGLRGSAGMVRVPHVCLVSRAQDVVNTHPGLAFLKEASEFHSRYITTVSTRTQSAAPGCLGRGPSDPGSLTCE